MFKRSIQPKDHPFQDFRNFLYAVWDFLGLPEPTPVQYDIAYWLQHGPKRSITEAYRGAGKSWISSALACWCWWHDPETRIMVVSGGKDRADEFSRFCLRLIREMPALQHLAPKRDQLKSLMKFEVNGSTPSHSPSMKSVGITGQLTGSRADLIIPDDIETPKNSLTITQREKIETLVTEFDAVLKPEDHTSIKYLGTPQMEDTLYDKLTAKGYEARVWPARMPARSTMDEKYGDKLAPWITKLNYPTGHPIDPDRFDEQDLAEREMSYGATGFALQFMLDTSLEDELRFPLKCRDMIVMDVDREHAPVKVTYGGGPDQQIEDLQCAGLKGDRFYRPMHVSEGWEEFTGKILYIDPAGRGADRTGYAVVNHLRGQLFLRRAGGLSGGYDDRTLETLAQIARTEQVNLVLVESNFGDGMFSQLLKPVLRRIYPCSIEEDRATGQKELRIIDTLEPVLNQHRLIVDRQVLVNDWNEPQEHSLVYQLTRLTKQKGALGHDDVLDAVAGAVAYWVDRMDVNVVASEEDHRREAIDQELDKWLEEVEGTRAQQPNMLRSV